MVFKRENAKSPTSARVRKNSSISADIKLFSRELFIYSQELGGKYALRVGKGKEFAVSSLYKKRGRLSKRLMHSGMAGITAFGVMVAPIVAQEFPGDTVDPWESSTSSVVLSATSTSTETIVADRDYRSTSIEYVVKEGETLSEIAEKFGVDTNTILWENDLKSSNSIKVGQSLTILPVTGISHKVNKGDTVYSIAKKYDVDAQGIVNYPFNTFVNDETFELAIGQEVLVPGGVMPQAASSTTSSPSRSKQLTPNAGTVVASGQFVWPTNGVITQYFAWYHKALDIANPSGPAILAADAGTVIVAGWPDNYGYGNRVVIDHGNGFRTLYAHMSRYYVVPGQTVNRGDVIGQMGNTGRSTGTHLHFEVLQNGVNLNPLSVLQ